MPEINMEEIKKVVVDILKREISPWLILLFGSLVKGNFRKDSDIDIAYLSDKEISNVERFWVSQEIADSLNRDIDLIDLKKASTVLKAQIVGTGEVIYCEDEKRKKFIFYEGFERICTFKRGERCCFKKLFWDEYIFKG